MHQEDWQIVMCMIEIFIASALIVFRSFQL